MAPPCVSWSTAHTRTRERGSRSLSTHWAVRVTNFQAPFRKVKHVLVDNGVGRVAQIGQASNEHGRSRPVPVTLESFRVDVLSVPDIHDDAAGSGRHQPLGHRVRNRRTRRRGDGDAPSAKDE